VTGLLVTAVCLGVGLGAPSAPPETESGQVLQQALWRDPLPPFLASALGVAVAPAVGHGLIPTDPPRALGVPAAARADTEAPARTGGAPIRVYFSRRPDSQAASSAVFPVARVATDRGVATAALARLIEGPTAAERAAGYFSELGAALTGVSSCSGRDFQIAIADGTATVRFCHAVAPSGAGRDARVRAQIDATLRQFPTIRAVRLIGSTGRCLFDLSGQDRCSGPPVQPRPGG